MTLFYQTNTWTSQPQPTEKTVETWKHASTKSNWRIVQLSNGFYQTEIRVPDDDSWKDITRRETIEGAEAAIDGSIQYYQKKLDYIDGPKVIKTFDKE
jgi:hypothetical protein